MNDGLQAGRSPLCPSAALTIVLNEQLFQLFFSDLSYFAKDKKPVQEYFEVVSENKGCLDAGRNISGFLLNRRPADDKEGGVMNAKFTRTLIVVAAFLMIAAYSVQAQQVMVRGDIPFDFIVGDQLMKAGEYTVGHNYMPNTVMYVQGYETGDRAARLVQNIEHRTMPAQTVLIFNRYVENGGETSTFLSQVWVEGVKTGREFLKARAEREAAARAATRDIITLVVTRVER